MLKSYLLASFRNVMRNKLFSAINIIGLAVGMSVGLLLIALLHDLSTYDKFNKNGKRIYRLTSHAKFRDGYSDDFATASIKIGKLIEEKVSGVEHTTILRSDFSGDAIIGDNVIPLTGMYTGPSMLKIFTMPMVKGNLLHALDEPYSIVLTETSAKKLFGDSDAFGKTLHVDTLEYQVTGILKDVPFFSHLQFESLVSSSTIEPMLMKNQISLRWDRVFDRNYVYIMVAQGAQLEDVQRQIDAICQEENRATETKINFSLLPIYGIMTGEDLTHSLRPVVPRVLLWIVGALAFVVIFSACFNYTNLSIARAMKRFKEVGLKKVIGAERHQVRMQFLTEAVIVSLISLILSIGIFMLIRPHFLSIAPDLLKIVKLEINLPMVLTFVLFSLGVAIASGLLPSIFFAKLNALHALKDVSSFKIFKQVGIRKALVVIQYVITLIFITSTIIGYRQYRDILAFDLGFNTENILNIQLQGNNPEILQKKLREIPEVNGVSRSWILTSVGNYWGGSMKYNNLNDSATVLTNLIDEHYLALHDYKLVAGQNFTARPQTALATSEVIVSEETLRRFNIGKGDPVKAIGEEILLNNKSLTIVGVMKDFHYGKLDENIYPVVFTYLTPDAFAPGSRRDGMMNVRLNTTNPTVALEKIRQAWKSVDPVHPFNAKFYDDSIEEAYSDLSAMLKVVGFLSSLAISIASLGLLGMVVFTTESRLKEVSIRKVLGASSMSLVFTLSRAFLFLLVFAGSIALPVTYVFFEKVVLPRFPFHNPIGWLDLFSGLFGVLAIAVLLIASQTIRVAHRNPAEVLKSA